jgi:hypothetical protein
VLSPLQKGEEVRKHVTIEEYHLTVLIPHDLPDAEANAIRQTLMNTAFERGLLRAVRSVFRMEASLSKAKVRLSR